MVTYTAEETVDPTQTIPRSLTDRRSSSSRSATSASTSSTCWCCRCTSVMTSTRVAADTFDALIGAGAAGVISALVMFSSFGALNGIVHGRPARLLPDGAGRAVVQVRGPPASALPDARSRDHRAGDLVVGARDDRQLSRAVHARDLHRVDLLRAAGARRGDHAAPPGLRAGVADGARPGGADPVHHRVADDCREPDPGRRGERGDGPRNCRDGIPGILFLGPPSPDECARAR